jgi:hypothetical protein
MNLGEAGDTLRDLFQCQSAIDQSLLYHAMCYLYLIALPSLSRDIALHCEARLGHVK